MKNSHQRSFTNFRSIAGKISPDNNRNTSLHENLSVKVFLHCRESRHPSQTFCRLEQVWPIGKAFFCVCHSYESAFCVDVKKKKKFAVTSPDFEHQEICGVLLVQYTVIIIIIIISPLTARVFGVPQMILQPVFSIFTCFPLPSGTWQIPGLSIQ